MAKSKSPCGVAGPDCFRETDPWHQAGIVHIAICSHCGGRFVTSRNHTLPLHQHDMPKKSEAKP